MNLPKELTTVTPISKAIALVLFISLPIVGFVFGMNYQAGHYDNIMKPIPTPEPVACTMEAKICPDGSAVGRVPPNCEFEMCPSTTVVEGETFTGTITDIQYDCHVDGECGVMVGKAFVIVATGEGPVDQMPIQGYVEEDLLNADAKSRFMGKTVEVYAAPKGGKTDTYTIYGNGDFYIRLLTNTTAPGGAQYTCPDTEWVDCMPGPDRVKTDQCDPSFLQWAQNNCPGFQGAAF